MSNDKWNDHQKNVHEMKTSSCCSRWESLRMENYPVWRWKPGAGKLVRGGLGGFHWRVAQRMESYHFAKLQVVKRRRGELLPLPRSGTGALQSPAPNAWGQMVQGGLSLHQITTKSTAVRNLFIEENQNFTRNKNNWEFMMNDDRDDDVDATNQEEHPLLVMMTMTMVTVMVMMMLMKLTKKNILCWYPFLDSFWRQPSRTNSRPDCTRLS